MGHLQAWGSPLWHHQVSEQGDPQRLSPFDLDLMMTNKAQDSRELVAKAEAVRQLKRIEAKSNAQAFVTSSVIVVFDEGGDLMPEVTR